MVRKVVIVGGGSAGWLTASIIASRFKTTSDATANSDVPNSEAVDGVSVTLVESPNVPTVGVGEGTWPTMRSTLSEIGISETEFFKSCDVSLKQGTRFSQWMDDASHVYDHPFMPPVGFHDVNMAEWFFEFSQSCSFAQAVSSQPAVCDRKLSAKQISTPEYAFNLNYGYHLNAGRFAELLKRHSIDNLGVRHIVDDVIEVVGERDQDIQQLVTESSGVLQGDLFIDCSGFRGKLMRKHYQIPCVDLKGYLFNDSALALQVPYEEGQAISSATLSTAQTSGWVWDIGLSSRRGVGYVFSSDFCSEEAALQTLKDYLAKTGSTSSSEKIEPKKLTFEPQHLTRFWHKNCVAVGLSAGFVEPLEASALVLVEMSAKAVAETLVLSDAALSHAANRFNDDLSYHWSQIVDFLKLHYVLSDRQEPYWQANRKPESIPSSLRDRLDIWSHRAPWHHDTPRADELFSSASFQYVLYGMNFKTEPTVTMRRDADRIKRKAMRYFDENQKKTEQWVSVLPCNKLLTEKVNKYGFPKV